jgi:hypothetical protein
LEENVESKFGVEEQAKKEGIVKNRASSERSWLHRKLGWNSVFVFSLRAAFDCLKYFNLKTLNVHDMFQSIRPSSGVKNCGTATSSIHNFNA